MTNFKESIYDLIVETSTNLPPDVRRALSNAMDLEKEGNHGALSPDIMLYENFPNSFNASTKIVFCQANSVCSVKNI